MVNIILLGLISYYYQTEFDFISSAGGIPVLLIFSITMINSGMMVLAYFTILGCMAGLTISYMNGIGTWLFHPEHPLLFGDAVFIIIANVLLLVYSIVLLKSKAVNRFSSLARGVSTGKLSEAAFSTDTNDDTAWNAQSSDQAAEAINPSMQADEQQLMRMKSEVKATGTGEDFVRKILRVFILIAGFVVLFIVIWLAINIINAIFSVNVDAIPESFIWISMLISVIPTSVLVYLMYRKLKKKDKPTGRG